MFSKKDITQELKAIRKKARTGEEEIISQTRRILSNDLFTEKKILQNLGRYTSSFFVLDEEEAEEDAIFTPAEIKKVAVNYRLKFLDSKFYKPEIPYEAILKIKELNTLQRKELKEFRILSSPAAFKEKENSAAALLFVKTNHDNYYMVHKWGEDYKWTRALKYWPLRSFENLVLSVIMFTILVTAVLPTWVITLDSKATYWSGYRGGVLFHLFIFNSAFTAFAVSAFAGNFSGSLWNKKNDYD